MAYLVLARKWRPQQFDHLVGQQHVAQTLTNAIEQNRIAHAFLFTGSRGVGKTSAARIFSKALNCTHGPTAHPCGECSLCKEITDGRCVDVIEIDGASNRGINEIREVREAVRPPPLHARYKTIIIDEVHMLTTEAFNALLKTLEEPPPHAIFIFATTEPRKIPVTILSRCQRYDFKRISTKLIAQRLLEITTAEHVTFSSAALNLIARHARGGMRDALSSLDQVIAFCGGLSQTIDETQTAEALGVASHDHLLRLSLAILSRDPEAALQVLDSIDRSGFDLIPFAAAFLHHLRDLAVIAAIPNNAEYLTELSEHELALARQQVKATPLPHLQRLFQVFNSNIEHLHASPSPRLTLEMTLLRLTCVEPLVPLEPLIQRLDALERALSSSHREVSSQIIDRYGSYLHSLPSLVSPPTYTPNLSLSQINQEHLSPPSSPIPPPNPPPPTPSPKPPSSHTLPSQPPPPSDPPPPTPLLSSPSPREPSPQSPSQSSPPDNNPDDEDHAWLSLISTITRERPSLAGKLDQAVLIRFCEPLLEFWLPEHYANLLDDQDRRHLEDSVLRLRGWSPKIKMFPGSSPPNSPRLSLAQIRKSQLERQLEQQRRRIEQDDTLAAALSIFGMSADQVSIQLASAQQEPST